MKSQRTQVEGNLYGFGNPGHVSKVDVTKNVTVFSTGRKAKVSAREVRAGGTVTCVAVSKGVPAELLRAVMSGRRKECLDSPLPLEKRLKKTHQKDDELWVEDNASETSESSDSSEASESSDEKILSQKFPNVKTSAVKRLMEVANSIGQVVLCRKCGISNVHVPNIYLDHATRSEIQLRDLKDKSNTSVPPHRFTQDGVYIASRDASDKLQFERKGDHNHKSIANAHIQIQELFK